MGKVQALLLLRRPSPAPHFHPLFQNFQIPPSPLREVIKIYSPLGGDIAHSILRACCPMYLSKGLMIVYNMSYLLDVDLVFWVLQFQIQCSSILLCHAGFMFCHSWFYYMLVLLFHVLLFLVLLHARRKLASSLTESLFEPHLKVIASCT